MQKFIKKSEPILRFGAIKEGNFQNPHCIALIVDIDPVTQEMRFECLNGGGDFILLPVTPFSEKVPFAKNEYVLIQQKSLGDGLEPITKIKDAGIEVSWETGKNYSPVFDEAIQCTVSIAQLI